MNALTRVHGRWVALSFDVCKQGGAVAFHFSTPQGIVVLTTSTAEFAAKCRGPHDHNGNDLPDIPVALTAKDMPLVDVRPRSRGGRPAISAEQAAQYQAAWKDHASGRFRTKAAAAKHHGITYSPWINWMNRQRQKTPEKYPASQREPVMKPGGKIL